MVTFLTFSVLKGATNSGTLDAMACMHPWAQQNLQCNVCMCMVGSAKTPRLKGLSECCARVVPFLFSEISDSDGCPIYDVQHNLMLGVALQDTIFKQGDTGQEFFVIRTGEASVFVGCSVLS